MKKAIIVLVIALAIVSTASAEGIGLLFRPRVAATLSLNNYFRGGALGGQVVYDILGAGILGVGVEAFVEYDTLFNQGQMPVNLLVSLGRDFYIAAGTVVPFGPLSFISATGDSIQYVYGNFPNNFAIGASFAILPLSESFTIDFFSEISYTLTTPFDEASNPLDDITGFLLGLKGYAGIGITLGI